MKGLLERGHGRRKHDYAILRPRLLSLGLTIFLFSTKFLWILKKKKKGKENSQVSPIDEEAADASQGLNIGVCQHTGTQGQRQEDAIY